MKINTTVQNYLESEPLFRERKNKDRGIVNLLIKKFPILKEIPKDKLIAVVQDYNSMDRAWRKILSENPNLRGSDYGMKDILEQQKELELGYRPGHYKEVKTLENVK